MLLLRGFHHDGHYMSGHHFVMPAHGIADCQQSPHILREKILSMHNIFDNTRRAYIWYRLMGPISGASSECFHYRPPRWLTSDAYYCAMNAIINATRFGLLNFEQCAENYYWLSLSYFAMLLLEDSEATAIILLAIAAAPLSQLPMTLLHWSKLWIRREANAHKPP